MRLDGEWLLCNDGLIRPVIHGEVQRGDSTWKAVRLQIDTGADRTVLDAGTLAMLGLEQLQATELLGGVGGQAVSVQVETQIRLTASNKSTILFKARFAAFTDPNALDMSVLGRDITNLFALIVDRPGDLVCLLAQQHRYIIQTV